MDHEKWLEQHDRMVADLDQKMADGEERHNREIASINRTLRRAVHLAVHEARNERHKRRELDDYITKLAAAQLITEERLRELIERDQQRRGGNGNPPAVQ